MKTVIVFFLLFLPTTLMGQTNVDRLITTLDSLSMVSFDHWKMSPDVKSMDAAAVDPTKPEYDDSRWKTLRIGESVYPETCWLRKTITIPKNYLGLPIGGEIKFLVSLDDYGYVWVNGESKGHFPWDGEFTLTKNAKPGQKFTLTIKACNTGGPLRLLRAEIRTESNSALRQTIEDLNFSLRVGQKLLSFDTYQTNARKKEDPGTDKSTMDRREKEQLNTQLQTLVTKLNVRALADGDTSTFHKSLAELRQGLKPIGAFARRFTLFFDANAHIDAAWLWREKETIEVCKNTFSSVFNMMNARPDFTYTQSAAAYYDWMERLYPDVFKGIQQRVKEGRWEITGGMWVEPDCNLPSGESWNRHLLYAKRYFRQKFGVDVKIGWNPDSFGYNANMPMFYLDAGIDAFVTQKIGWNEKNVFPHRLFWWESPDGSRILSYFPFDYVNEVSNPYQLIDWMRQFEANTGMTKMMILFGVGDHGGGPSLAMIDRIERLKTLDIYPAIEYGTTAKYIEWLRTQDLNLLPVWKDELYLEYHQGTYTTQAKIKEANRTNEMLLTNAEKISSLASLYGRPYNATNLEEAWRKVLFNQFHDILPGSSIREVYIDAQEHYAEAAQIGTYELNGALQSLMSQVNTTSVKKGTPFIVFNALSWERNDLASLELPEGDKGDYTIFDGAGREVPSQIHETSKFKREIKFVAEKIPSLGYRIYSLRKQKPMLSPHSLSVAVSGIAASVKSQATDLGMPVIENMFFRIMIDPDSGWIRSIVDKRSGKELLSGYGNELQLLEDRPTAWDAWNIGLTGTKYSSKLRKIEVVEQGPVRAILRITRDYLKPGVTKDFPTEDFPSTFFTQDIILYDKLARIDFQTNVDWWEDKTMLKVAFPLTVNDRIATYEIPYGTIERSTGMTNQWDSAKVEVPAHRWADLSQDDYGVSLLTKAKYGFDIKGNTMRLSLLRSPRWPDETADRGKHAIEYSLYPHSGRLDKSDVTHKGFEYNNPLLVAVTGNHKGSLPTEHSFLKLEPSSLILTTLKKAEDGDGMVLQWYNISATETQAQLTLPKKPQKVVYSNVLEEDRKGTQTTGRTISISTKGRAMSTVKIYY